jgi:hypothetical protein
MALLQPYIVSSLLPGSPCVIWLRAISLLSCLAAIVQAVSGFPLLSSVRIGWLRRYLHRKNVRSLRYAVSPGYMSPPGSLIVLVLSFGDSFF